jgi:PadR family transcriptional regulator PadR
MASPKADQSQMLKGLCELALLKLLSRRAHYGLEILQLLRSKAGLELADGTIYPLLHRLAREELVAPAWRLDEAGARPRKYYALTKRGRVELAQQVKQWWQVSGSLSKFLSGRDDL